MSNQNNKEENLQMPNVKAIHMLYGNKALLELKKNEATPFVIATCVNSLNIENFIEWSSGRYFCDKSGAEEEMVQFIIQSTLSKEKYSENEILGVCKKIFELNSDMDYLDYGNQEEIQEEIFQILTSGEPSAKEAIFASVIEQCNLANTDEAIEVMMLLNSMLKITEEKEREMGIDVINYLENAEISTKEICNKIDKTHSTEFSALKKIKALGTQSDKKVSQDKLARTEIDTTKERS